MQHEVPSTPSAPGAASAAPTAPAPAAPIVSLPGYTAVVLPVIALAAQFAIGLLLGVFGIGAALRGGGAQILVLVTATGLSALSYLAIVHAVLRMRGWRWADLGLGQCRNGPIFVAIAIGLATAVLGALYDTAMNAPLRSPFRNLPALEFLLVVLTLGILVPIAEEILFRGIVFPVLKARLGDAAFAILVSALIFGAFHLVPAQIVVGVVLGLPLAWLRHWSGSLLPPIALHMTHNLGVVALIAWNVI